MALRASVFTNWRGQRRVVLTCMHCGWRVEIAPRDLFSARRAHDCNAPPRLFDEGGRTA